MVMLMRRSLRSNDLVSLCVTNEAVDGVLWHTRNDHQGHRPVLGSHENHPRVWITNEVSRCGERCGRWGLNFVCWSCCRWDMTVFKRSDSARENKLCRNCLRAGHSTTQCRNAHRCRQCHKSHHTLLHFETLSPNAETVGIGELDVQDT